MQRLESEYNSVTIGYMWSIVQMECFNVECILLQVYMTVISSIEVKRWPFPDNTR